MKAAYHEDGYYLKRKVLSSNQITTLKKALSIFKHSLTPYGIRDLLRQVPSIHALAYSEPVRGIAQTILGPKALPIRSVFFDKLPQSNWNVAWHQDTSIAVNKKVEMPGFSSWSEKQGIVHTEPPLTYLKGILTLRIHLDVTDNNNGVLRVVPQSHRNGRIRSENLIHMVENANIVECHAEPGDILLMSTLS